MKRATKLWIAVAVILAGLGAAAGSLASDEAGAQAVQPLTQTVRIFLDEEGVYRVDPGTLFVTNGEEIVFKNLTGRPVQVMVPRRSFWNTEESQEDGGGILEVGATTSMKIQSYYSARGPFIYQVHVGGLPPVGTLKNPQEETEEWKTQGHTYTSAFAIGNSPPRMIVQ